MKKDSWISLATGAAAGALNGFFGGGAGMLLVPLFIKLNRMDAKKASATSLAITLALSFVTLAVYLLDGGMPSVPVLPFMLGGSVGAVLGALLMKKIPSGLLRYLLAGFMIFSAVRTLCA